jgi:hypothetical protein
LSARPVDFRGIRISSELREGLEMLGIPHDASARAVRLTGLDFLETVRECFSLWLCRNSFSDEKG